MLRSEFCLSFMDIFDQLSSVDVPPPPATLDRDVHCRLNHRLLTVQLVELFTQTAWFAFRHFARAFVGLCVFTVSGKYVEDRRDRPRQGP
ncbi:MAG TPA: hypothetical protein VG713_04885 [Pirellulales bacterium]|nr:hypothetical protein [Pirellulales bacterium]